MATIVPIKTIAFIGFIATTPPPLPKNNNDIGCYVPVAADVVMN